jgi:hypothetical protein
LHFVLATLNVHLFDGNESMSQLRIKGAVALWRDLLGTIGYFVIGWIKLYRTPQKVGWIKI